MKPIYLAATLILTSGVFLSGASAHNGVDHSKPMAPSHSGSMKMNTSMHKMMSEMKSMKMSGDVDEDFAQMMARHHQSGIEMAQMEVDHGTSPELKAMAKKMIGDQSKEQEELVKWVAEQKKSRDSSVKK